MNEQLCILATGGTIDKDHDPISENLIFSGQSHVPEMLLQYRAMNIPYDVLMQKDSSEMNDQDREIIKQAIEKREETAIIVTHGTSTMADTARYLSDHIKGKTIVLTGAMRPFSLFRSDAGFNLGTAIAAARTMDHGIYIAMNGQIFNSNHVKKNIEQGFFESTS